VDQSKAARISLKETMRNIYDQSPPAKASTRLTGVTFFHAGYFTGA
jgi:hypothetical protein